MFQTIDSNNLNGTTLKVPAPVIAPKSSNSAGSSEAVLILKNVKNKIVSHFLDIPARLQIATVPACLLDLQRCAKNHSRLSEPCTFASISSQYLPQQMCIEARYRSYCKLINDMIGRGEFPDRLVLPTLEIILTLDPSSFKSTCNETVVQTLDELYSTFTNITLKFPPCYYQVRQKYKSELLRHSENEDLSHMEGGILCSILDLLRDAINYQQTDKPEIVEDESRMLNFFYWEKSQVNQKTSFKSFDRNLKFERLFKVLDLILTRILEYDMALWLVKYASKTQTYIHKRGPLITAILWQNNDSALIVNATIKKVLSIFCDLVALDYPKRCIKVFTRLLNLVANASNLYEYPDDTIQFPIYKNITSNLVDEIVKVLESSPYYSLQLFLKVIENVEHPLIKMLLSQKLFQKLDSSQSEIPPSLEQVYQRLISEKLLDFPDQTEAETSSKASAEKYPLHDKNYQMPPKISLSKVQYVRLLRIQAEAIIEYYKIDKEMVDCIGGRSLSNSSCIYDPKQPTPFNMAKYENFEEDEPVIDRTEAVAMKAFDKQFKKHVHIKIDLNSFYFYKTQAKYKLFLNQHIQQNFINDGAVFSDFFDVTKY